MSNHTHHDLLSYARADNGEDNSHFITRLHELLRREHEAVTGRELKTFFDSVAIDFGERWKTQLGQRLPDFGRFYPFAVTANPKVKSAAGNSGNKLPSQSE